MKLGMQVGFGPGHIVLDGDPAPPLPIFGPYLLWRNGCMDQNVVIPCIEYLLFLFSSLLVAFVFLIHVLSSGSCLCFADQCHFLWPLYVIGRRLYFCPVISFYLLSSIFFYLSFFFLA